MDERASEAFWGSLDRQWLGLQLLQLGLKPLLPTERPREEYSQRKVSGCLVELVKKSAGVGDGGEQELERVAEQ